ncbi:CLUMA_CG018420, isoform A [Clunio marinus]|uniref:CLUMA_CG018420, isoform A n=1 Tax=Clunio marinus TaxID=568069 RepID=A0A1J1J333_9DIPT|nr:CLUMA_CG018420, isoform A [Clunio marinus]
MRRKSEKRSGLLLKGNTMFLCLHVYQILMLRHNKVYDVLNKTPPCKKAFAIVPFIIRRPSSIAIPQQSFQV